MAEISSLLNCRTGNSVPRVRIPPPPQLKIVREVAQAGSAPGLGPGGRRFESCLPDKEHQEIGALFLCTKSSFLLVVKRRCLSLFNNQLVFIQ